MKPIFPISNMATFLFRKGTAATERDFESDGELMQEMLNRKIRVQDILLYLTSTIGGDRFRHQEEILYPFIEWFAEHEAKRQDAQHEQDLRLEMEMFSRDK